MRRCVAVLSACIVFISAGSNASEKNTWSLLFLQPGTYSAPYGVSIDC